MTRARLLPVLALLCLSATAACGGGSDSGIPEGKWQGPTSKSGEKPTLYVEADQQVSLDSGGHTCSGRVTTVADTYRIILDRCIAPVAVQAKVADDRKSMVLTDEDGKAETWYLREK
ncbi:hypothetical protein GCM10023085_08840 [Actinomadura viridis]|uniref:Uncharacterized protein n=1 Tax=Actinomadura viridis TaxID=58110 RepID=A0A931GMC8_9ACTN|nr:hypothetical protein [Actinomadura viridis]MBG6091895.1 hypothetical protein [Actinomadura viridis]